MPAPPASRKITQQAYLTSQTIICQGLRLFFQGGSFENGVGKQELPSFFEITVDRQASELFLHNH